MQLIVVTYPEFIPGESDKINSLFEAGMEKLHIRKPNAIKEAYIELLEGISPKYYDRIKIHEFFELADNYTILGVHLNARNPEYLGKRKVNISKSCHSIEELEDIDRYDYVFLSPVFDSISKEGYQAAFSNETLTKASSNGKINQKVIALGGINGQTLPLLKSYSFGGAAVLGAIWQTENVVGNLLKLRMKN